MTSPNQCNTLRYRYTEDAQTDVLEGERRIRNTTYLQCTPTKYNHDLADTMFCPLFDNGL